MQGLGSTLKQELSKTSSPNCSTFPGDCCIPLLTPRAHLKHSLSNLYTGERISKNFKILSSLLRLANCRNVCWINFRSVLAWELKCWKINYFKSNQWRCILRFSVTYFYQWDADKSQEKKRSFKIEVTVLPSNITWEQNYFCYQLQREYLRMFWINYNKITVH